MAGISPDAYRAQAAQAGETALGQLSANFAQRGMLNSGALTTAGAQTLSRLYTDADARDQQDRMNAIGMALGGQQAIQRQYAGMVSTYGVVYALLILLAGVLVFDRKEV